MNIIKDLNGLELHLQRTVSAQGSASTVKVVQVSGANSVSASISHLDGEIRFEVPEDYDILRYETILAYAKRLNIRQPSLTALNNITLHEIGHHRLKNDKDGLGCPVDLHGKEIAVDATARAMAEQNRFSQGGACYLENVISDIIDNANVSKYSGLNGLCMFFAEQAELNNGKFSPLYEAFAKLNMKLWGRRKQKRLMAHYFTNDKKVDEVVAACIKDVGLGKDKPANIGLLFDKDTWNSVFYGFAKHLAKLMDASCPESLPGSGSGGKGYKVPAAGFGKKPVFDPAGVDDPMLKKLLDPDNMKKLMLRRNQSGETLPAFVEDWKALDYFYRALASELRIKAESAKKGMNMPIAPIQARPFDYEKDRVEDLLFGRVLLDDSGKPCLAAPRSYVEQRADFKKIISSYPTLNIAVLDCSESMLGPANDSGIGRTNIVPWGDNSKYHYALLAYYGVEKALHAMRVATRTRYNMITFSQKTSATGEKSYDEKDDIRKRMLSPQFGNTTELDISVLAKHCYEKESILMTISDGEIYNWDSWYKEPKTDKTGKVIEEGIKVKDQFKQIISDKFYVHFQIGEETIATQDIRKWGATIIKITNAEELPKKAIEITQTYYKSCMQGEQKWKITT